MRFILYTRLLLAILCVCTLFANAQTSFYIQQAGQISKVTGVDPSTLKPKEWQVRLYKRGQPTTGIGYWGLIKGASSGEVMKRLKENQEFEVKFNAFIGKGFVQDEYFTHFNPFGPIAVMLTVDEEESPDQATLLKKKFLKLVEKAKEEFDFYSKTKEYVDVILNPEAIPGKEKNPYENVGDLFKQYTDKLKGAYDKINSLKKNMLREHELSYAEIDQNIKTIEQELAGTRKFANQIGKASPSTKSVTENANIVSSAGFYVFFSTSVEFQGTQSAFSSLQSSKTIYIISQPMYYAGDPNDPMLPEKAWFVGEIKKQFPNESENMIKILSQNNYATTVVHFGKPYSRSLLKTKEDGMQAIVAYKNSIIELLEGISPYDFFQLE